MGYALWLVPSEDEADDLQKLMMALRPAQNDLPPRTRSYPHFHPHITLATFESFPHFFRLRDVIPREGPVKGYFRDTKPRNTFLGAMPVRLRRDPELARLHGQITTRLGEQGIRWKSRGFPHMSLFYVDEASERERLKRVMEEHCTSRAYDGRLLLWTGIEDDARAIWRFTGSSVWLMDCRSKDVKQWSRLDRVSLSRTRSSPTHRDERDTRSAGAHYAEASPPTSQHRHAPVESHHRRSSPYVQPYPRPAAMPNPAGGHAAYCYDVPLQYDPFSYYRHTHYYAYSHYHGAYILTRR